MAISKCGKCNGTSFEVKEVSPSGGRFKHIFVQCSACGTPAGMTDFTNTPAEIHTLKTEVAVLSSKLDDIHTMLRQIKQKLGV